MNILLSVPLRPFRRSHPGLPDLGLGYLAASLIAEKHRVHLIDWNDRSSLEDIAALLRTFRPRMIGLKFFTLNVPDAVKTVNFFRDILGDEPYIVVGGPHPSAEESVWLAEDFPRVNARFLGEAEETLVYVAGLIENTAPPEYSLLAPMPGFEPLHKENISSPPFAVIENLDNLTPPAWDLIDPRKYPAFAIDGQKRILAPLMTTRGCPQGCSFCCVQHISGRRIRHHSIDYVLDQISFLRQKFGVTSFSFLDTNFMTDISWLSALLEKLLPLGSEIVWNCIWGIRGERYDGQLLKTMQAAGCRAIIMGIESGDDTIRKQMGKPESVEQITGQVHRIAAAGIGVHGFFMLGFPGETRTQMSASLTMASKLPLEVVAVSMLFPLPGSHDYDYVRQKYGLERIDWRSFDLETTPFSMSSMSSRQVLMLKRRTQIKNMLHPARLLADVRRGLYSKEIIQAKLGATLKRFMP